MFDRKVIEYLRELVGSKAERFDFEVTMHKWAQFARGNELDKLISVPPTGGRRRIDWERRAAVLLAVIYYEYARKRPTRVTWKRQKTKHQKYRSSDFYLFADQAFEEIGVREVPDTALREAVERWPRSRGFSKWQLRRLLWL